MKTYSLYNPKPRTDLGGTSGKNSLKDRLIKPVSKSTKWVAKTNSKIRESKIYNKAINNFMHRNR